LKTEATKINHWKRLLKVEVPVEEVTPHIEKAYRSYQKKIHLEGFRKGKVPLSIVRNRFGKAIQAEVSEDLVQTFFKKAVESENLALISPGVIKDISFSEGEPLQFTAEVAVEPEIEVKNYKGLKLEKEIYKVIREDVEQALQMLQEQKAEIRPVDGAAENGHILEGDIQALNESNIPIVGQKWEDRAIVLGEPPLGDQVQDQLLGVGTGEERRFKVVLPEKEPDGRTREIEQHYSMNVKAVKEKVLPEITDDFAKEIGEFQRVNDLKEALQKQLRLQRNREAENRLNRHLMDEVIKRNDSEIPEPMVENALNLLWENYKKQTKEKTEEETFKQEHKAQTVWNLKWQLIHKKIAEIEEITVTDEDLDAEIEKVVQFKPEEAEKMKAYYRDPRNRNRLRSDLLETRTIQRIREHGRIKEIHMKKPKRGNSSFILPS
jgi:trigger factor